MRKANAELKASKESGLGHGLAKGAKACLLREIPPPPPPERPVGPETRKRATRDICVWAGGVIDELQDLMRTRQTPYH